MAINIPNSGVPIIGPNGQISRDWYRLLNDITRLLNGQVGSAFALLTGATFSGNITISNDGPAITLTDTDTGADSQVTAQSSAGAIIIRADLNNEVAGSHIRFDVDTSEVARLTAGLQIGSPTGGDKGAGSINASTIYEANARVAVLTGAAFTGGISATNITGSAVLSIVVAGTVAAFDRTAGDGLIVSFRRNGSQEGGVSVSGTTVTYNGGHLARWSQWGDGHAPASAPLRGTVLSNLDQKCVWIAERWFEHEEHFETVEAKRVSSTVRHELYDGDLEPGAVYHDEHGQPRTIVQEANEQLNCVKVSDVDADRNQAGIFESIDEDGDLTVATRGEFLVRIAAGTTVERGDMLVSAGDGTARPLDPDAPLTARLLAAVIGKVMTTERSETYPDGSYLIPTLL